MPKDKKDEKEGATAAGKAELGGPQEASREGASNGRGKLNGIVLPALLILVFGVAALHFSGIINISGLLNPNSGNYVLNNDDIIVGPTQCFDYSTQMDTPCCTTKNNVRVSAVYAIKPCLCPKDTVDYQYDVVAGGKELRTCDCKCPESS